MTPLPWARPRFERLLLLLVACAALSPVYLTSTQDVTRLCLTRSLVQGKLTVTPCVGSTIDRAVYHGRTYTDKAPGQSLLALPAVEAVRLPPASEWTFEGDPKLWAVRVLVTGVAFLLLAWAVGRLSEGLAPGFGGAALVTFALGTLVAPLAASSFDHDLTAAFGFAAFLLAWRGSPGWAGLCAGLAVLCEYQGAATAVVVAAFVALRGAGALARYALAALPPLALLGAYDWAAFGSPFHLSYRYVANRYSADQQAGFFGIHLPSAHSTHEVFVGDRGLLVASPVLVAAAAGLALVARRHRAAALAAAAVAAVFLLVNCGYFLPYGGISPGPRFLVPALPFLALGLAPAFARRRAATAALAAVSVVAMTAQTLTWASMGDTTYRQTIWGEVARLAAHGRAARLDDLLANNALVWLGPSRVYAAIAVSAVAAAAFVLALRAGWARR